MIFDEKKALRTVKGFIHNDFWTAIIPAAGRGTRLQFDLPKALFPLKGKALLDWVVDRVSFGVSKIVVVISPKDEPHFREWLIGRADAAKISFAFQPVPLGTVDALLCSESKANTPNTVVVWGDHYSIQRKTVQLSLQVHEAVTNSSLTFPTCERKNPYIAVQRDAKGKIIGVEQAREKSMPIEFGENDCGMFAFNSKHLFEVLHRAKRDGALAGKFTNELNLLTLLPLFESRGRVNTLRIADISETMGVNTREEVKAAENVLTEQGWNRTL